MKDPHAEGDLWGFLWLVKDQTNNEKNDRYYAVCLRNEFIRLSKKEAEKTQLSDLGKSDDLNIRICVNEALKNCTDLQKKTAVALMQGYSILEIATALKVSRQAVNRTRSRIREKLRDYVN